MHIKKLLLPFLPADAAPLEIATCKHAVLATFISATKVQNDVFSYMLMVFQRVYCTSFIFLLKCNTVGTDSYELARLFFFKLWTTKINHLEFRSLPSFVNMWRHNIHWIWPSHTAVNIHSCMQTFPGVHNKWRFPSSDGGSYPGILNKHCSVRRKEKFLLNYWAVMAWTEYSLMTFWGYGGAYCLPVHCTFSETWILCLWTEPLKWM